MAGRQYAHGEAHDPQAQMRGDEARRHRHGRIVEHAERDGENQQQLVVADDLHQQDERHAAKDVDEPQQQRPMHAIGEIACRHHAQHVEAREHAVGGRAVQRRKTADNGVGDQVRLDHARGREAADRKAPEERVEHRTAEEKPEPPAERLDRGAVRACGARIAASEQQPEHRRQRQRGEPQRQIARSPAGARKHHRKKGHQEKLAGGRSGGGDAGGEPAILVEMQRDRRADHMIGDRAEPDRRDHAEEKDELPLGLHRGHQRQPDRGGDQPKRQQNTRPEAVERVPRHRRHQRHDDQRRGARGRDEAPRPAELGLEYRHGEAERCARRHRHAQAKKAERDDQPAIGVRFRHGQAPVWYFSPIARARATAKLSRHIRVHTGVNMLV